jgi:hypothetical protein
LTAVAVASLAGLVCEAPAAASAPSLKGDASAPPAQRIALLDRSRSLSATALERGARALTYQVNRQVRRFWTTPPIQLNVVRRRPRAPIPVIELLGAKVPRRTGGYHTAGPSGRLQAAVYLRRWGPNWTVAASHELLEMLIDPQGETIASDYLEEICDPVQFVWYRIGDVYVSDFVTPAWFSAAGGPWDLAGRLAGARRFARGGEEDNHSTGRWTWIGPGAHMKQNPPPIKLGEIH